MSYMIQAKDADGRWDESLVGSDIEANTFRTRRAAMRVIPALLKVFSHDETPPTVDDFRIVKRK